MIFWMNLKTEEIPCQGRMIEKPKYCIYRRAHHVTYVAQLKIKFLYLRHY